MQEPFAAPQLRKPPYMPLFPVCDVQFSIAIQGEQRVDRARGQLTTQYCIALLFQNGAKTPDLRCVLRPSNDGAGCKTCLEPGIKKARRRVMYACFPGRWTKKNVTPVVAALARMVNHVRCAWRGSHALVYAYATPPPSRSCVACGCAAAPSSVYAVAALVYLTPLPRHRTRA